ncbi:nicastrin [Tribolium castaneum]|uniref:Nicastrin n=1 Tax=Tribolium castaneum TaxID=7070 RepID=D2A5N1_TRICA|nr:PREDICTED: nicastrin [Tribolium castaneum]EFA05049.2 Nicastrin-like Protein [Tribolium castaneum]|eukprot:XP_008190573.1 PREDICTED: nicastrin [Tribolium castaneum]
MDFNKKTTLFRLIIISSVLMIGNGIRTKDKMYENIDASKACFRRLNATHQIGCTSERGGSTGAIHFCASQSDLDFIIKNGTAPPYVPIIPTNLFTSENIARLKKTPKISGLLVYPSESPLQHFTHEQQCPNPASSLPGSCKATNVWNPHGTGLLYHDIPFPVFYVESVESLTFAKECFEKYNNFSFGGQRDRSLCSLQLLSFMYAATNSSTCIRRSNAFTNLNPVRFCDPLGDQNVWAALYPLVKGANLTEPNRNAKYIIVGARLDTTSMFDKTAGAVSPVTGLVALLATAKLLKEMTTNDNNYEKNVLFVIFNGETYDYIGSQRFVYELLRGKFPAKSGDYLPEITIDDIDLFVELSQLNWTETVVAHYLNKPSDFLLKLYANKGGLNLDEASDGLPPGSLHTFLKNRTELPSLILTDHRNGYLNNFYNSIYDNATNLNYVYLNLSKSSDSVVGDNIQKHIQNVSTMLAKSLYSEITSKSYFGEKIADLQFIDELFYCYLEDSNCRVHQAIQKLELRQQPLSLYIGVELAPHFITTLVGLTLGWVTGDVVGEGNANCTNEPKNYALRYYNMSQSLDDLNTTLCYRITMNFTEAVSPAFIIDGYDWSSGQYSTWTESTWGDIKLRIFLKPSAAHENMTIAIGSIVFIFSLIFVYFVKSRSHILFAPQLPTLAPTNC